MNTTYRVTSYNAIEGTFIPGELTLYQMVTCLNLSDALAVYEALKQAGFGVMVQEAVESTTGTLKDITPGVTA